MQVYKSARKEGEKVTDEHMQVPKSVQKEGEKLILFPDNFSNPYNKLSPSTKSRTVHFIQNDAQPQMTTKVYVLKHLRASDITPFILGAVKRFSPQSNVQRLNYKHGKKQFLVVSTGQQMMPYVDKMIEQLDIPGLKDQAGSIVSTTGITRGSYQPKYRSGDDFVDILNGSVVGQGYVWNNEVSNIIYWKTDHYHSEEKIRHWLKYMDRPLPQARLTFNVYEVRESDLLDYGIDYNAWKNGPGLGLFNFSFQDLFTRAAEEIFNSLVNEGVSVLGSTNFAWGGLFFAPPIDMSFIRLLSQRGSANVAASGSLTVVNDYTGSFPITLAPEYQNIRKGDNDQTDVVASAADNAKFHVTISKPIICMRQSPKQAYGEYNYTRYAPENYKAAGGAVIFSFKVTMNTPVERNNLGQQLIDSSELVSSITLNLGSEKIVGSYDTEQEIEQLIGIPWLIEIPYVRHIFGTTTKIKMRSRLYVTVKGELIHPDNGPMPEEFVRDVKLVADNFKPATETAKDKNDASKTDDKKADAGKDGKTGDAKSKAQKAETGKTGKKPESKAELKPKPEKLHSNIE
jgi:type II secretory pathway component GspD/PulD (secretin)